MYDCNYNIGEKCYKPMLDQLDRKYSAPFSTPSISSRLNDDVDLRSARRTSPFASDFNSIAGESSRRLNAETRSLEEDLEDDIVNSMRKLKVLRAAKAASVDDEPTFHSDLFNGTAKKRF